MYVTAFRRFVPGTLRSFTPDDLQHAFAGLGIARGSIAPVHRSFGAMPGSFPLYGGYMLAGNPNWATKHLRDALLQQHRLELLNDIYEP